MTVKMTQAKFYWLVAGQVFTVDKKGIGRSSYLNVVIPTDTLSFARNDIGRAQQTLLQRFVKECEQVKGAQISDVFILSVNNLGYMTEEQFHAGFPTGSSNQEPANKDLN